MHARVHRSRLVAATIAILLVLAACGGGGGNKASSSDNASDKRDQSDKSDQTSSSKKQSAQAKKAADDLNAARRKADTASGPVGQAQQQAFTSGDLTTLKSTQAQFRDIDFEFDKEIRAIDFPDDVAEQRNAYFTDNSDVIAAEDDAQATTSIADFQTTNRKATRIATKRREDAFTLLRDLGSPDPADKGHADAPKPSGKVVLQDDFSDPASGWTDQQTPVGSLGYASGHYVVLPTQAPGSAFSDTVLTGPKANDVLTKLDQVSVEADVVKPADTDGFAGVACHTNESPPAGYVGLVDTTGSWLIGKLTNAT